MIRHVAGTLVYNTKYKSYYYSVSEQLSIRFGDNSDPYIDNGNSNNHWNDIIIDWNET